MLSAMKCEKQTSITIWEFVTSIHNKKVIYKNAVDDFNTVIISNFNYNNMALNVNLESCLALTLGSR